MLRLSHESVEGHCALVWQLTLVTQWLLSQYPAGQSLLDVQLFGTPLSAVG